MYCVYVAISRLATLRELMVALRWLNFKHEANDLLFFFSEELYTKIAELSCLPSTEVTSSARPSSIPPSSAPPSSAPPSSVPTSSTPPSSASHSLPPSKLLGCVKMACAQLLQFLAMEIRCAAVPHSGVQVHSIPPLSPPVGSLHADVLKTSSTFLQIVSKHLYGQLQCFIAVDNPEIMKLWKVNRHKTTS